MTDWWSENRDLEINHLHATLAQFIDDAMERYLEEDDPAAISELFIFLERNAREVSDAGKAPP